MSAWLGCSDLTSNESMTVSYWRSVDQLHDYAQGPLHREAWNWWNKTVKQHPYLSISHEIFSVPKGNWETIYANYHPTNMGMHASYLSTHIDPIYAHAYY